MAPNPRRRAEQLDALYARLPKLECQGHCHDTCGPIEVSVIERDRMEAAAGKKLTCGARATCSMLTPGRRCGVYEVRPLICRLWGLTESLPCHYGCRPEGGLMSDADAWSLMVEALAIGGDPGGQERRLVTAMQRMVAESTPEQLRAYAKRTAALVTPRPSLQARSAALPPSVIERSGDG